MLETTECNLFVLDQNTWYHKTVSKHDYRQIKKKKDKKCNLKKKD